MNQRINDILSYLDQDDVKQDANVDVKQDANVDVSQDASPPSTTQIPKPNVSNNASPNDLSAFNDNKVYNKFSRQLKKNKFPMIFNNQVFNNEGEAQVFKQQVLASRRDYKRNLKKNKIQESQMNFDALPTLNDDSSDFEDLFEDDGYVYRKSKSPYAVVKDGKKKIIPKTSTKDAKKIYKSIESTSGKDAIKHLVKAESEEDFRIRSNEAMNKVNDEEIKNSYHNHVNNNLAEDKTWNQASFLKMMYQMMKENEELKSNAAKYQQTQQQQHKQNANPFRLNPALMKK